MNKKWTPHIIAAGALAVFIVLGLACATVPQGEPPTYKINTKPVASGTLQGKKAVIFNMKAAKRGSAFVTDKGGGSLFSLIMTGVEVGKTITFNNSAKKFDKENDADLQEAFKELDEVFALVWQAAYNAETVQAEYNFGKTKPKLTFFNKPNAAIKNQITDACKENNAEFAVTIIQQIQHGYLDKNSLTAVTYITAEICVFNNKGAIITQASAILPNINANAAYGLILSPNNGEQYVQLYLAGAGNIIKTLLALDSSAAITFEGLMEGVSMELATTEITDEEQADE
jgi:hypothetical protein